MLKVPTNTVLSWLRRARAVTDDAEGGDRSSSEYSSTGSSCSVSLTYRVPQANYQSFLDAVAAAGNVTYRSQQADDVTTQYMDVSARLSNLQAQHPLTAAAGTGRNSFRTCCRSRTLTEVQSQIESWQSQLDWYSDQVQQCTVYIDLNEVQTHTRRRGLFPHRHGPVSGNFCERLAAVRGSAGLRLATGSAGVRCCCRGACMAQKARSDPIETFPFWEASNR